MIDMEIVLEAMNRFNQFRATQDDSTGDTMMQYNDVNQIDDGAIIALCGESVTAILNDTLSEYEQARLIGMTTGFHIGVLAARLEKAEGKSEVGT